MSEQVTHKNLMHEAACKFAPAWWCRGPHAQTISGRFLRGGFGGKSERLTLETPDGDFFDIDLAEGRPGAPVVLILHGLEGSSSAPYVRSLLAEFAETGWNAVALNFRGCSFDARGRGRVNRRLETYHSGKTEDFGQLMDWAEGRFAGSKIFAVGFSIGGNVLIKWLGEQGEKALGRVHSGVAISVPYDLVRSVERMDRGFNRSIYTRMMLSSLKKKAAQKALMFPGSMDLDRVLRCRTFAVFDREVTARLNGFRDEMHYWTDSSSCYYLHRVRVPVRLIHAADDPFFPGELMPFQAITENPFLELVMTDRGGHLGFVGGLWPWRLNRWLEQTVVNFLKKMG